MDQNRVDNTRRKRCRWETSEPLLPQSNLFDPSGSFHADNEHSSPQVVDEIRPCERSIKRRCRWQKEPMVSNRCDPGASNAVVCIQAEFPQGLQDLDCSNHHQSHLTFYADQKEEEETPLPQVSHPGVDADREHDDTVLPEVYDPVVEADDAQEIVNMEEKSASWGLPSSSQLSTGDEYDSLASVANGTWQDSSTCNIDHHKTSKQIEFERLAAFLYSAELSNVSQRAVQRLISLEPVKSAFSLKSLTYHAIERSHIEKSKVLMCPLGHAAQSGSLRSMSCCPVCNESFEKGTKSFWFLKMSSALRGLCNARESFSDLMNGCRVARNGSCSQRANEPPHDYYNGAAFLRLHASRLKEWNEDEEIIIFLTLSTDGFECGRNRNWTPVTTWPVVSSILNLSPEKRSKASNAIILAVIPGSHDSRYFDSFLEDIVNDLSSLEKGVRMACFDEKVRTIKAFVVYFTADWPAATKVFAYVGHNGTLFCRFCRKSKQNIKSCKGLCAVPELNNKAIKNAFRRGVFRSPGDLIRMECPKPRTSNEVLSVWRKLSNKHLDPKSRLEIVSASGIKRKSVLSRLNLDYVFAFPYDAMHLILLGWVKHVLRLLTGSHPRHERAPGKPNYCIEDELLGKINRSMSECSQGIPSSWGRSPLSLEHLSKFKAEDFKRHAELYLVPFFHRHKVQKKIILLLSKTSEIVSICFSYDCGTERVNLLKSLVEELYAKFCDVFYLSDAQSFCFTPTTHAIMHLPELLRECGPLPVSSQFLVERLLGEVGKRIQSKSQVTAHLFHKNFRLFALRLANNGISPVPEPKPSWHENISVMTTHHTDPVRHLEVGVTCHGVGYALENVPLRLRGALSRFLAAHFSRNFRSHSITSVRVFRSATLQREDGNISIESKESFRERSDGRHQARQKHHIAAHFIPDQSWLSHDSDSCDDLHRDLYYGSINKIFGVAVDVSVSDKMLSLNPVFFDVSWEYGIIQDSLLSLWYTEGRRRFVNSVEIASCIDRQIGVLDICGRRYYLDKNRKASLTSAKVVETL